MIIEGIKISERDKQLFTLKVLNSPSPRFFFFITLAKKGFTDPFFRLLDSPDRNVRMP
jgi:hypothetical protein